MRQLKYSAYTCNPNGSCSTEYNISTIQDELGKFQCLQCRDKVGNMHGVEYCSLAIFDSYQQPCRSLRCQRTFFRPWHSFKFTCGVYIFEITQTEFESVIFRNHGGVISWSWSSNDCSTAIHYLINQRCSRNIELFLCDNSNDSSISIYNYDYGKSRDDKHGEIFLDCSPYFSP